MKAFSTALLFVLCRMAAAQVPGGDAVFNFLKLPNTPQLTALGGVNITQPSADIGLVFTNPALLKPAMHAQMNAVFNSFYGDIKVYHLSVAYRKEEINTNFSFGLNYFDYGKVNETDASGNIFGKFHPTDWVMQVSASRSYLSHWNYGATLKYISSNYGQYRSNGIALDIGILFSDSLQGLTASIVAKNMGTQIKKYESATQEDLPFELQAGITKKLKDAPFSFSLTAQRLQHFDIRYEDAFFNNQNGFANNSSAVGKVIDHLVLATTIYAGERIEIYGGYNFLRRKELNSGREGNGLNGFSVGAGALLGKFDVRYARSYYQSNSAFNQFGLNLMLDRLKGYKRKINF